jgi:amino acid transporter
VRDATGLVRSFSTTDVFLLNVFNTGIGVTVATLPPICATLFPSANIALAVTLGAVFALSSGWVLMALSVAMPRSGGDYVYNTRLLHPIIGFVTSFNNAATTVLIIGLFASWIPSLGLSSALLNYGIATGNSAITNFGQVVATPNWTFGVGALSIVLLAAVMLAGGTSTSIFMKILSIPCFISLLIMFGLLATSSHVAFVQSFNSFAGPYTNQTDSYTYFLNLANKSGYTLPTTDLGSTIYAAIFTSVLFYIGFQFSVYMGGEVKHNQRAQPIGIMTALLVTTVVTVAAAWLWYNVVVGADITNALVYLSTVQPQLYPLPVAVSFNFFAGLLTTNIPITIILAIGTVAWYVMLVFVVWLENTRILFAWAFDRVIPIVFANVGSGGAPTVSILFTGLLSATFLGIYTYVLNLSFLLNTTLLYCIVFLVTAISAIVFPIRRKELFNSSPRIVNCKIGRVPVLVLMGVFNVAVDIALLYLAILFPAIGGPTGTEVYAFIAGILVTGFIIYEIAKFRNKRRGIDMSMAFKEIPPE